MAARSYALAAFLAVSNVPKYCTISSIPIFAWYLPFSFYFTLSFDPFSPFFLFLFGIALFLSFLVVDADRV